MDYNERSVRHERDSFKSQRKALEEKDRVISELQQNIRVLRLEYTNEKSRVYEKVNRLTSELEFMEKSRFKKEIVGGYDIKAMQTKIDELQRKLDGCKHKSATNESSLGVVRVLDAINLKLDAISKSENRNSTFKSEKQLEAI